MYFTSTPSFVIVLYGCFTCTYMYLRYVYSRVLTLRVLTCAYVTCAYMYLLTYVYLRYVYLRYVYLHVLSYLRVFTLRFLHESCCVQRRRRWLGS